ncbi:acyltransferase [Carboxydothermus ferrireducens]|uniref:Acetyltransferase-like isoleucine patch superfamily enzyme n=1 Tax=Carboxydothermus ferrireducens DSM 11255 TaxID=1119529 RepID=A0ABX2R819_9THEO|nr:acyltransferase [Carboxydothermus ferrireducens]NYE57319.1 acetyltransferase-like isoleucine patch superfamily enzyme [Carboxydothermus ferrireducens DSM 11255]
MRRLKEYPKPGPENSMYYWRSYVSFFKVAKNFIFISIGRYLPFLGLKRWLYRYGVGMKIGKNVSLGLMMMPDVLFPELIEIGDNTIIGYNATILTHEFRVESFKTGPVKIGRDVLIGANATILAGVEIGDGAMIGAGAVVTKDIPPGVLAVGVPARVVKKIE